MSKQVNKAQEKSEGSRSQRNIILACVIFVLLFCKFSNILGNRSNFF